MDAFVRRYIHENLSYRFVLLPDGSAAYAVEAAIKSGEWEQGRPLLNPAGVSRTRPCVGAVEESQFWNLYTRNT
jgi:hypothetical protein